MDSLVTMFGSVYKLKPRPFTWWESFRLLFVSTHYNWSEGCKLGMKRLGNHWYIVSAEYDVKQP